MMRPHRTDAWLYLRALMTYAIKTNVTHVMATVIAAPRSARLARYRLRMPRTTPRSCDCSDVRPEPPCTLSITPPVFQASYDVVRDRRFDIAVSAPNSSSA